MINSISIWINKKQIEKWGRTQEYLYGLKYPKKIKMSKVQCVWLKVFKQICKCPLFRL